MNKANHNKIYTAAELRRYHSGHMTPGEMHALERAALEDPMLADALEGYGKEIQGEDSLALINQKLDAKFPIGHAAKIVSFNKKIWSAIAVAASILLISGYAFFAMRTDNNSSTNETQIALNQSNTKKHKPQTKNIDSITPNNQNTRKLSSNPMQLEEKKFNDDASTTTILPIAASSNEGSLKTVMPYPETNAEKHKDVAMDNISHKDEIIEDDDKQILDKKTVTNSSTASGFIQSDSNLATDWAVANIKNQQVVLESIQQNNQLFENDGKFNSGNATSLNEVIVTTAQDDKKERKKANIKATASVGKINPIDQQNSFTSYVVNQHPVCYKAGGEKAIGNVVLEFKVDKKGRPMNITVASSLSDACDKEAIRLLSSGPDWEIKGPKHRKAVISFK